MTGGQRTFETGIEASDAVLPDPPRYWSYSALKAVEACPRRHALSRASYPNLWEGRGYPQVPNPAAIFGDVVHGAIELIVKAFVDAGCSSAQSADAVTVLKDLGGYTTVAEKILAGRLGHLDDNPRLSGERRRQLARELARKLPDARVQIQTYLSRLPPLPTEAPAPADAETEFGVMNRTRDRREISRGPHPELELIAESLRLLGRVDLLMLEEDGARITDFKTGAEDPSHEEQLLTYALLWARDHVVNPRQLPCRSLQAAYPNREKVFSLPDDAALEKLESNLATRIKAADEAVEAATPEARPSDHCRLCGVRPLCADYWDHYSTEPIPSSDGEWFDLEGRVTSQHGAKSWVVEATSGHGPILVRTPSTFETLPLDRSVRLLGVRRVIDPDDPDALIAAMGASTETFVLI